ncbi:MAG TPA: DUF2807 domain-containing protein [Rhizomicrobium sp.]|nr:DUF2807 domain-containing protein [Rhizomicrobium sp.]
MKKIFALLAFLALPFAADARGRDNDGFIARDPVVNQPGRWEWAWDGNDGLSLEAPVTLHYRAGGPPRIIATGPDEILKHLRIGQGHIWADDDWHFLRGDAVTVTVTGVTVHKIALAGSGTATAEGLDLDHLRLSLAGSGALTASGRADQVDVSIAGSGAAQLEHLAAQRANITIAGSGDVMLSPREEAHVSITGSGAVHMASRPPSYTEKMVGSGAVRFGH